MIDHTDIKDVAAALGVSTDSLVSYGQTMLVKPGTVTNSGTMVTGPYVERALRSRWQVFPQAVEYGPGFDDALIEAGSDDTEIELAGLEDEVGMIMEPIYGLDDDPEFGVSARRSARMKKRYMKLYGKLVACQELLKAGKGYNPHLKTMAIPVAGPFIYLARLFNKDKRIQNRAKRCDKLMARLTRVRQRMERKGIDVTGLPDPTQLASQMQQKLAPRGRGRRRSVRRPMRRNQGGPRWRQQQMQQQPQGGSYVPTSRAVSDLYHQDQAALEREVSSSMPNWDSLGGEDRFDELAADLRSEAQGFLFGDMEHDYYGMVGYEDYGDDDFGVDDDFGLDDDDDDSDLDSLEQEYDDMGLDDDDLDDDDDLGLDDDDLDEDELGLDDLGLDDDDLDDDLDDDMGVAPHVHAARIQRRHARQQKLRQVGKKAGRAFVWVNKQILQSAMPPGVPTPPVPFVKKGGEPWRKKFHKAGRRMNRMRGEIMGSASYGSEADMAMLDVDSSLRAMSPNDGVEWGRIRPLSMDTDAPLVVMVAMRKRPDLLQVLGSMNRYPPVQAAQALRVHTDAGDWVGADGFPAGKGAPLPPPRRIGREVYAG